VLALANRLVPKLGGAEKTLRPTCPDGPDPVARPFGSTDEEGAAVVAAIRALECPLEDVAILARTNARLTDFEELLHEARIPFQGASLLERDAARRLCRRLERSPEAAAEAVRAAAVEAGWVERLPDKLGDREQVRQQDLGRLVALAAEFDGDAAAFVADLRERFAPGSDGAHGVHLLTFHRAKGLEFETVFLPRLQEKELPSKQARSDAEVAEERRLLYVGLTRAKRVLWLSWCGRPSPFLRELGVSATAAPAPRATVEWSAEAQRLREWRAERAKADNVPAYVVFHDSVLQAIAAARPATIGELARISGVGPTKLERYGSELLALVAAA
jgi:DNA helicase-2/ATP-dependent DNA helicase PcrA